MRTFEWWVDFDDLVQVVMECIKETRTITQYLIETFKIETPCNINLRLIREGV